MIRWLSHLSVGLAAGSLALVYGLGGLWIGALCSAVLGILWLASARRWARTASAGLILSTVLCAFGLTQGLAPAGMLVCLVAALTAWDLDDFHRLLESKATVVHAGQLQRQHLQRLVVVNLLGLVLGLVALNIGAYAPRLTLGLAVLLGLLAILGLSRAISFLRRESD